MRIRLLVIMTLIALWGCFMAKGSAHESLVQSINRLEEIQMPDTLNCDTICDIRGYGARIVKKDGEIVHVGLNLFSDEMKRSTDRRLLEFVEEALLAKALNVKSEIYGRLTVKNGSVSDFKGLSPESDFELSTADSKSMTIEWPLEEGSVSVEMPLNYDVLSEGTRSDIEREFIDRIKSFCGDRAAFEPLDTLKLEPYGEEKLVYPGKTYLHRLISRNIYLNAEDLSPVCDAELPSESMANLIILPSEMADSVQMELTVLKHEYGEKETLTVPLGRLLAACEDDGCAAYWGTDKYEDGVLTGSVFLYNPFRGFDHVIRVECEPEEVLSGRGAIRGSASLFIPMNNVKNLFAPYIKKSEDEKIKYNK